MTPCSYLNTLAARIASGVASLPERFRAKQRDYLASLQQDDGGFPGRSGGSDLYYTGFALRALTALGDESDVWPRAASYAHANMATPKDVIECFSLLHVKSLVAERGQRPWTEADDERCAVHCAETLAKFQCSDDGHARAPGEPASLYATFLATLSLQMIGAPSGPAFDVSTRQCADGGFSDTGQVARGETNPTAAAIGLAMIHGSADEIDGDAAGTFLAGMQRRDGGFAAHAHAPVSDLLSTFTAAVSLASLDQIDSVKLSAIARFLKRLQSPAGGFIGASGDNAADAEYTYYGIGLAGLLAEGAQGRCRFTGG